MPINEPYDIAESILQTKWTIFHTFEEDYDQRLLTQDQDLCVK
jgi:hypothetical protein